MKWAPFVALCCALALLTSCSSSSNGGGSKIAVSVSPGSAKLGPSQTQQFTATVTGTSNTAVNWSVSGGGTIDSSGNYTAPAAVSSSTLVTVTATSQADSSESNNASVTLLPINVSVTPGSTQLGGGQTQQFYSTVTGTSNNAVNWSVTGSGTVDSSGIYTAPAAVSSQTQATVTATSQADLNVTASATVTLMPVALTISPTALTFGLPGRDAFAAAVKWSSNVNVTWSLSPSTNSGTVVDGLYTTPTSWTPTTQVQVIATSSADPTKSASATVTLTAPGLLPGQYAFFFQGTDGSGMMQDAGSFAVDNVHLTVSGTEDIVQLSGAHTAVPFTGSYTPVNGTTGRSTLTITDTLGTRVFNFNVTSQLQRVHFTEDPEAPDTSGIRGVGLMQFQDPTAFPIASTKGNYAFGISGTNTGSQRVAEIGEFALDGVSAVSGVIDINNAGATQTDVAFSNGTYTAANSTTGRGTASVNGLNMVYYIISANEYLLLTVDNPASTGILAGGNAQLQSGGPFTASSLGFSAKPNDSVFYLVGAPNGEAGASEVAVGFLTSDGVSNVSITQMDENSDGTVTSSLTPSGPYTTDASGNGRGTIQLSNGGTAYRDLIFYLVSPDTAYLLDNNTSDLGSAVALGYMEPQSVQDCGCTTLSASYVMGSEYQATTKDGVETGSFTYTVGTFNPAEGDISEPVAYYADQAYTASAQNVANTGRGTFTRTWTTPETGEISPENFVLYLIARDRGVAFSTQSTQTNPVLEQFEK
jgi:hypothetical protein